MNESLVNTHKFNTDLVNQAHSTRRRIVGRITRMSVKGKTQLLKKVQSSRARTAILKQIQSEGVLSRSLFAKFGKDCGEIDLVSFKFPIHGIYAHHGVSKHHPASNKRKGLDWLNPVVDEDIGKFADIVAKHYADATLNATRIKI
jgi:hypothetical protein